MEQLSEEEQEQHRLRKLLLPMEGEEVHPPGDQSHNNAVGDKPQTEME